MAEPVAGILLAAGESARMGRPKQLLDWHGRPLVRYAAEQALDAGLSRLVVVTGAHGGEVAAALAGLAVELVANPRYIEGQGCSLAAGIAALPPGTPAAIVLLCDQPLITATHVRAIMQATDQMLRLDVPPLAVVPRVAGQRGHPVALIAGLFPALRQLSGDQGARAVLQARPERIAWLDSADPAYITDLDTPEQYQWLTREMHQGGSRT